MSNIIEGAIALEENKEAKAKSFSVECVLKEIKEHTFGCVVAGGYCRDVFHGVAHKDIDICMYNFHPNSYSDVVLVNMLWEWLSTNVAAEDISAGGGVEYMNNRIHFVWHLPYHNVDIICWNVSNHTNVLSGFDCNLNQFYLPSTVPDFDNGSEYLPDLKEKPVYFGDGCPDSLVFLKELPDERVNKMIHKHQSFYPDAWCGTQEPVVYFDKMRCLNSGFGKGLNDIAW